jgi:hypothetical protein
VLNLREIYSGKYKACVIAVTSDLRSDMADSIRGTSEEMELVQRVRVSTCPLHIYFLMTYFKCPEHSLEFWQKYSQAIEQRLLSSDEMSFGTQK